MLMVVSSGQFKFIEIISRTVGWKFRELSLKDSWFLSWQILIGIEGWIIPLYGNYTFPIWPPLFCKNIFIRNTSRKWLIIIILTSEKCVKASGIMNPISSNESTRKQLPHHSNSLHVCVCELIKTYKVTYSICLAR